MGRDPRVKGCLQCPIGATIAMKIGSLWSRCVIDGLMGRGRLLRRGNILLREEASVPGVAVRLGLSPRGTFD